MSKQNGSLIINTGAQLIFIDRAESVYRKEKGSTYESESIKNT